MKTSQFAKFNNSIISVLRTLIIASFFSVMLTSCGDDDSITIADSSFSFDELNTCDIGGGALATRFNFTIPYDALDNITVSKILFGINWSNGDTDSSETTSFNDTGSQIEYNWCYRFGSDDWVEITHRLEIGDGMTSNSSAVTINKPDGAN